VKFQDPAPKTSNRITPKTSNRIAVFSRAPRHANRSRPQALPRPAPSDRGGIISMQSHEHCDVVANSRRQESGPLEAESRAALRVGGAQGRLGGRKRAHSFASRPCNKQFNESCVRRARGQLQTFAAERGLPIVSWYVENESGAKLARPELFRLLSDAQPGDILLVEQVDRLSRLTAEDWERLKAELTARHVRVVALDHILIGFVSAFGR
jgi:hypothetical protein